MDPWVAVGIVVVVAIFAVAVARDFGRSYGSLGTSFRRAREARDAEAARAERLHQLVSREESRKGGPEGEP